MSRKRKSSLDLVGFEDIESNLQDELYDILYKTGNSSHFSSVWDMFNKPFQVKDILARFDSRLADLIEIFSEGTNFGFIEEYIHLNDVIIISGASKPSAMRRFHSLGDEVKKMLRDCKYHPGESCYMVEQNVGFLLYLAWIDLPTARVEEEEESTSESLAASFMDVEDVEVAFQPTEESALVEKFNTAMFRAETITKVEDDTIIQTTDEDETQPLQCLPVFPTYCFNNREYLLLSDIQYLFEMREDFCLAVLARWGEFDRGFTDSDPCPLAVLDTKGEDFIEKREAALYCTNMFEEYEKQGLPTEEEFKDLQRRLGISDMGLEGGSVVPDSSRLDETKSSINLYSENILELDEEPQIDIEDTDQFLARAKGSRMMALGKSQGLFHYIGKINKDTVAIFHSKYTENSQLPLLAFKALSRVVGSRPINKGVDKIILLEKQEAIRIFGYMPGFNGSRAAYFATLGAYMLAHVGCAKDLLKLKDYRKQEYLRFRGKLDILDAPLASHIVGDTP